MRIRHLAMVSMHTSPIEPLGSADAGGMNVVELNLAMVLPQLGYEVDLITRRTDPSQPDLVEIAPGVRLIYLEAGPPTPLAKSQIDQHIPQFAFGLSALKSYDLFHCQHWMSGIAALDEARRRGVPHLVGFHSIAAPVGSQLSAGEPPESPARLAGEVRLTQESDHILAVSIAEASTIIQRLGGQSERVTIIPPGVDLELFHPGPRGKPSLVFAARLQPLKGLDLAIAAMGLIRPDIRPRLLVAGADSLDFAAYSTQLRDQVRQSGLGNDVVFMGPTDHHQLAVLYRQASAVLIPSYSETFSLVALEAQACGTPVLASAVGGLPEAIVDGFTGYLIESREPQVWASIITNLLEDPVSLSKMGTLARIHARRFTWQTMATRVVDVYQKLLS